MIVMNCCSRREDPKLSRKLGGTLVYYFHLARHLYGS
jgi:hypothetical protein